MWDWITWNYGQGIGNYDKDITSYCNKNSQPTPPRFRGINYVDAAAAFVLDKDTYLREKSSIHSLKKKSKWGRDSKSSLVETA